MRARGRARRGPCERLLAKRRPGGGANIGCSARQSTREGARMKYVITGGSGYIGSRLTELLVARDEAERVVDVDVRPPAVPWPKTEYVSADVRDRARMRDILQRARPDALIHLAFLLSPIRADGRMYDI